MKVVRLGVRTEDTEKQPSLLDDMNSLAEQPFLLSEFREKDKAAKKEKKKDKKKKKKDTIEYMPLGDEPLEVVKPDGSVVELEIEDSAFLDYYEDEEPEDDDEFLNRIVDPNRKSYKKLLKEKNKFKRMYAEELTLSYDLLKETDRFSKLLTKKFDDANRVTSSSKRSASISKFIVDLAQAVISSKKAKLDIIKEIAGIKKTSADLKMKYDEKMMKLEMMVKDNNEDNMSSEVYGSTIMDNIIRMGRKNFQSAMTGDDDYMQDQIIDPVYDDEETLEDDEIDSRLEGYTKDTISAYKQDVAIDTGYGDDYFDRVIESRLASEGKKLRSEGGNSYIVNENRDVQVKIRKFQDGSYDYFAEDKDGNIVDGYETPVIDDREFPIAFSNDNRYATDKFGRTFKVVQF